jgi:hypothetical protein
MFPTLTHLEKRVVNLNECAEAWLKNNWKGPLEPNPLLHPEACAQMAEFYEKQAEGFSGFTYGGYLENRSVLWRGSYMEADQRFIHLGVDFNVPQDTLIAADSEAEVIWIDNDYPEEHGWGTRVMLYLKKENIILIYGHVTIDGLPVGKILKKGEVFARIAPPATNGGWFPHLHVQAMTLAAFEAFKQGKEIDGYGRVGEFEELKRDFPDPMPFVSV